MGLFTQYEKPALVYNKEDRPESDEQGYPSEPDETIPMHLIRLGAREQEIFENVIAEYESNPSGDVTARIKRAAWVLWNSKWFKVVNEPEYLPHMQVTKVYLVRTTQPHA